jgi:hypothetical protein
VDGKQADLGAQGRLPGLLIRFIGSIERWGGGGGGGGGGGRRAPRGRVWVLIAAL